MRLIKFGLGICCVASLVLASLIAVGHASRAASHGQVHFEPSVLVLPTGRGGDLTDQLTVSVVNDSDAPVSVVGLREFCARICYYGKDLPVTIPAKGRKDLSVRIRINDPGEVHDDLEFFTTSPEQPILRLSVQATLLEPESRRPDPADPTGEGQDR